ncbi:tRNA-intron endonuclease [Halorientalis persicus]|jgi:tRNA-intron endonuclease|uniref:tRNA-splicing endonuclease n=1 Tax=Halorientalis persicus TaxID=1367881 RepID=A0A1H8IWS2_9EURY|nr:tRNA-intron lyase [Halorientalis persicus]SEN72809.1 tRNA-intron endonuclease [Halorientalis persicus]
MDATLSSGVVRAGRQAREQFHDARGYGDPDGDGVRLAPVEAAHLLYRGDLDAVDGMGFREFLASATCPDLHFLVYKDLRDRGFYLSPTGADWVADHGIADLVVYPRGKGPWDDEVAYRVRVVSERATVPASDLGDVVLAVVDEESEITYLETDRPDVSGSTDYDAPDDVPGSLLDDRVLLWDPPAALYEHGFYGQPLDRDGETVEALQLSLVEAAFLVRHGALALGTDGDDESAVLERGRTVEGDRFDRRLRVYTALREAGVVPKTGYKFGADFRTYADVESVSELSHSELLVRVVPDDHEFAPRDLALDVRLAGGVRKRMVFALAGADGTIDWLSAERLTP